MAQTLQYFAINQRIPTYTVKIENLHFRNFVEDPLYFFQKRAAHMPRLCRVSRVNREAKILQ